MYLQEIVHKAGVTPLKGICWSLLGQHFMLSATLARSFFVKTVDEVELLAMLGLFGAICSGIQITVLEREELKSIHWSSRAVFPYAGFAAAMFLFYSGVDWMYFVAFAAVAVGLVVYSSFDMVMLLMSWNKANTVMRLLLWAQLCTRIERSSSAVVTTLVICFSLCL